MPSRLRKTFAYPSSDSEPSDLDEEHQEALLTTLQTEDQRLSTLYQNIFLCIPLASALYFLVQAFATSLARSRLVALLSLTSLLCTAYILKYMPVKRPDGKLKRVEWRVRAETSPVEKYLPYLNAALVGLLSIWAWWSWQKGVGGDAMREALPAIVFGLSMLVSWELKPLNLDELKQARYELRGA